MTTKYIQSIVLGAFLFSTHTYAQSGNVGIGTATPAEKLDVAGKVKSSDIIIGEKGFVAGDKSAYDAKSIFSTDATDKGFYIPRLTTTQKIALGNSLNTGNQGLLVFDIDSNRTDFWDGNAWKAVGDGLVNPVTADNGLNINPANNVRLGGDLLTGTQIDLKNNTLKFINTSGVSGSGIGISTTATGAAPAANTLVTVNPNGDEFRNGIDMSMSGMTNTATGINISSGNAKARGFLYTNSSSSTGNVFWGSGSVLSSTNIVSGYNAYRNSSGLSYGLLGITGTNTTYANNNANTWALFAQGRAVISGESSPKSTLGTDLEIRNTTVGAGNPVTVSLRQTATNTNANTILGNVNFGDENTTDPQAQIQVLRDAASSGNGDLPTAIAFSTTDDGAAAPSEKMRITNSGEVGIGTPSPTTTLDVNGTMRLRGGNPDVDKVLVSTDINGNATWRKANEIANRYSLPNTGGAYPWVKLGTLNITNGGKSAFFKIITNTHYDAHGSESYENNEMYIRFKTGGTYTNGVGADAQYYIMGREGTFVNDAGVKFVGNAAGNAATAYDLYVHFRDYTGDGSFYTVETTEGSWTHSGTVATDPGAASATIAVAIQEFNVRAGSLVVNNAGNVGIGTTAPYNKLAVTLSANDNIPALGDNGGSFALLKNDNNAAGNYGFLMGVLGSGSVFQQVQRTDANPAIAYNLLLQPNGGNVGIGTIGALSKLSVGDAGNANYAGYFKQTAGNSTAAIYADGGTPASAYWAGGINASVVSGGGGYAYGIMGGSTGGSGASGRAYGVYGKAGGGTSGWNYGTTGELLPSAGDGAGIYGVDRNAVATTAQISGKYAGYFDGKVNVNGDLSVSTLAANSAVYTDASKNLTSTTPNNGTLGYWTRNNSTSKIYNTTLTDNVGIGTNDPNSKLDVRGGYIRISEEANPAMTDQAFIQGATGVAYLGALSTQRASFGNSENYETLTADNGNIGINNTDPRYKLHVNVNNNGLNLPLMLQNLNGTENSGNAVGIGFVNEYNPIGWAKAAIVHERTGGYGIGKLHFLVNNNNGSGTSVTLADARMTIQPDGKVGIGATSPTAPLDVNGKIRGTAVYGYGTTGSTTYSTSSTTSSYLSALSATVAVQSGDVVKVDLACNLYNSTSGQTTYMRGERSSGAAGSWAITPNWITNTTSSSYWSGGYSTGLWKASADGNVTFQGYWHVGGGTGYAVYCNIIAVVIGKE